MTFEHDAPVSVLRGRTVVDNRYEAVGTVTDVLYDDGRTDPSWAIVKIGALRGEHYMPLPQSYVDDDGRLVVPFDKTTVKRAPKARKDHVITPEVAHELRDYYGRAA